MKIYNKMISFFEKKRKEKACKQQSERQPFRLSLLGLPFEPDEKQVIYIENQYNKKVNDCIKKNLDTIVAEYQKYGYEFVYLPSLTSSNKQVSYYAPYLTGEATNESLVASDYLLNFMDNPENRELIYPSLIAYFWKKADIFEFAGISLPTDDNLLDYLLNGWLYIFFGKNSRIPDSGVRFCEPLDDDNVRECKEKEPKEEKEKKYDNIEFSISKSRVTEASPNKINFSEETDETDSTTVVTSNSNVVLKKEIEVGSSGFVQEESYDEIETLFESIQKSVNKLKAKGITLAAIHKLIDKNEKVSRLLITNDYRIFLPDYNNMEIVMGDLPKALFFVFLNHPEGIIIKNIGDYYNEMFNIYRQLKPNFNEESLRVSVTQLCNPVGNRINENIARIRAAFVKKFDEHLAQNYFVTGKKGDPYRIMLDRKLVEWEDE